KQKQPKEAEQEQPSIWRRTRDGRRYCQIPPIHETDDRTGTTLQKMMEEEGLTAQSIIAEAVALRQAYKEGRLVLVEQEVVPDVTYTNFTEDESEDLPFGTWTYEPAPEKDDWVVENEELEEVELVVSEERSPLEELIETFQEAMTWEEIREALLVHEDYKHYAWSALTPIEKKRVRSLMPIEVKKLSEAKKAGLIVDFQELREGVYQVRRMGNVLGEIVSASRLDAFLAQLRCEGQSFA
ncbi:MAG: hypothetical protein SAK29_36630, partial [Scytonema sp. PMC 1069.18]|nr:hypothetical protein [Scytonema sp. PMC 1069.18]MEC4887881.1 hypothetical protein [Scytonema sp. PMC 1070.18]